jgi:hypothetical protein
MHVEAWKGKERAGGLVGSGREVGRGMGGREGGREGGEESQSQEKQVKSAHRHPNERMNGRTRGTLLMAVVAVPLYRSEHCSTHFVRFRDINYSNKL